MSVVVIIYRDGEVYGDETEEMWRIKVAEAADGLELSCQLKSTIPAGQGRTKNVVHDGAIGLENVPPEVLEKATSMLDDAGGFIAEASG